MAKIFPIDALTNLSAYPLTPSMIKTLKLACEKQNKRETLSQVELNGSFIVLVKRGLIDCKQFKLESKQQVSWYVTKQGIQALKDVDSTLPC